MYTPRAGDPREWLSKEELKENQFYAGKCRNSSWAKWKDGKFHYIRYKFGESFWEEIEHPEDDRGFDVFFPFKEIKDDPISGH